MSVPGMSSIGDVFELEDSVWPVPGNIIKEFGGGDPKNRFDSGVIIETTDQARVIAVAAGTVARIDSIPGGWFSNPDSSGSVGKGRTNYRSARHRK